MPIEPDGRSVPDASPDVLRPRWTAALWAGLRLRCPRCGATGIYRRYLKLHSACPVCGADFARYPTDDAPPYFTILAVGHIVIPLVVVSEQTLRPALWIELALWPSVAALLSLVLLPRIKAAVLGVAFALDVSRRPPEDCG
jgi:uncharacterized protein (DUF983 family)